MEIVCHIVGITNAMKIEFIEKIKKLNYNIIDIDDYTNIILNSDQMTNLFKQYQGFKDAKNDKYKDIDKKMTIYWETKLEDMILENISSTEKNILIGYCHHYKNINKRLNVKAKNKFLVEITKKDVRDIIKFNLNKFKKEIISGAYPINNIDFDTIYNNRIKIDSIYAKGGYIQKTLDGIYMILSLSKTHIKGDGLWIASTIPYNDKSLIHPYKSDKIFAFTDITMALLNSFNFSDDEIEKVYEGDTVRIIPKKDGVMEKLNDKRYLYLVEKDNFIPHEKGNMIKYFSQSPVVVIKGTKIRNVYNEYFNVSKNKIV